MSRVVHFEIQADDVERATSFYAAVFGWTFEDYSSFTGVPYWDIVTGPDDEMGINGGLLPRPVPAPAAARARTATSARWAWATTTRPSGESSPSVGRWRCPRRRWSE